MLLKIVGISDMDIISIDVESAKFIHVAHIFSVNF